MSTAESGKGTSGLRGPSPILVVRKARQVLGAFSPQEPALTARQVQQRTGMPLTTCLRLLYTMVDEGFLDRRGDHYRPGLSTLRWAAIAREGLDIVSLAQPVLEDILDAAGESSYLYLRDGTHHVCVAVAESRHAVKQVLRVGQVLPLHAGSAARIFLAYDSAALEGLKTAALPSLTAETVTDSAVLRDATTETRAKGYEVSFGERSVGAASLSAPVFDHAGSLAAVIGVAAPRQRFSPDRVPSLAPLIVEAARRLSGRLGYEPAHVGTLPMEQGPQGNEEPS